MGKWERLKGVKKLLAAVHLECMLQAQLKRRIRTLDEYVCPYVKPSGIG
jgi:hypothetical protein